MNEVISKLKEAIEIKKTIAKHEAALFSTMSEALILYLEQSQFIQLQPDSAANKNEYLNTHQAAAYLGLKYGALASWRFYGTGPKFIKLGRSVRYRIQDLDNFAAQRVGVT